MKRSLFLLRNGCSYLFGVQYAVDLSLKLSGTCDSILCFYYINPDRNKTENDIEEWRM